MQVISKSEKIVVFDLDETLGSFVELGIFWDAIEHILKIKSEEHFFEVLDLFQEFIRPNILQILKFLKNKKRKKICSKVMIYTNNQGPKSWAQMISNYFNYKLNTKLFDQIIAAFKVRGKQIEICRTSHEKSVDDLIRCTKMPKNTQICFLDDQYHPLMEDESVLYINVKPYDHSIPFHELANEYHQHFKLTIDKQKFIDDIIKFMKEYKYNVLPKTEEEYSVDKIVGKQMLLHLEEFLGKDNTKSKTRKKINNKKGKTKKRNKL